SVSRSLPPLPVTGSARPCALALDIGIGLVHGFFLHGMTFYATSSRGEPLPMNLLSRNLPPHDRSTHAWPEADRCGSASSVDAWPSPPPFPGLRLAAAEAPPGMEPEALADPFVTLGDRGGFSRVLLAEVRGAQDMPLLPVAVKLQSDEYPF